ncbi:MAG: GNAT family N-acetyltransferase [Sphingomicrobium sp.]
MPHFRDAKPADAAALSELGKRTFTETFGHLYAPDNLAAFLVSHSPESWQEQLSSAEYGVRVIEHDGELIGYAKLGPPTLPFEPWGAPIELRQFYILKPWQGAGLAPELMQWVLDEARRRSADELYLSVFTDNHRARRFYARYGFTEVGPYKFMVGTHADEDIVMRLQL